MRSKWAVFLTAGAVVAAALLLAQKKVDEAFRYRIASFVPEVHFSLGEGQVRGVFSPTDGSLRGLVGSARITSRLLRRDCSDRWTFGPGARVAIHDLAVDIHLSSRQTVHLTAKDACFDIDVDGLLDTQQVAVRQGKPISIAGTCGPRLEDISLSWSSKGVTAAGTVSDESSCLKTLTFLNRNYPEHLIPESVSWKMSVDSIDWQRPQLAGKTPVTFAAELARRLRNRSFLAWLSFETASKEEVVACLRNTQKESYSEFEVELGVRASTLLRLTKPFVSGDTGRVLMSLRSDQAACDGSAHGLFFTSDLKELRLRGEKLQPRGSEQHRTPGFRTSQCKKSQHNDCEYRLGIIQMGEDGKLIDPLQLETLAHSLAQSEKKAPFLVTFVHGWRHTADSNDQTLRQFEGLLEGLARRASSDEVGDTFFVVGVYISWPGRLFNSHAANQIATFWNRLEVAGKMGHPSGDAEAVLTELSSIVQAPRIHGPRGAMALFAHSMGAVPLLDVLARATEKQAPGDVAILINPAVSVSRYNSLRQSGLKGTPPLIIYGSQSDQTTRKMYPLGAALSFKGHTRSALADHTTTITNDMSLATHRLRLKAGLPVLVPYALQPISIVSVEESILPSHADFLTKAFVDHLAQTFLRFAPHSRTPPEVEEVNQPSALAF